jgi:hypothetical protein
MAREAGRGYFEAPADDGSLSSLSENATSQADAGPPADLRIVQAGESLEDAIRAVAEEREIAAERIESASCGLIAKPSEESLLGYKQALIHENGIRFSPRAYGNFDGLIVKQCGETHTAFNTADADYDDYAPLRRNLSILRNYLLVHYPAEGEAGQANIAAMRMLAVELGRALSGGGAAPLAAEKWWQKILRMLLGGKPARPAPGKFLSMANMPDQGIAFMYAHLRKFMESQLPANAAPGAQAPRDWKLLPLEQTPFSGENMERHSRSSQMGQIADAFELVARQLRSVDDLRQQEKDESVQHAKDILENMRIIVANRGEKRVDVEDPVVREARVMLQAAVAYRNALVDLASRDSHALGDPGLNEAADAVDKLSYRMRVEEKEMQREEAKPEAQKATEQRIAKTPSKNKTKEPVAALLKKLDVGFNRANEMRVPARLRQMGLNPRDVSKQMSALRNVRDGMSNTMSGPKITQVSNSNFVDVARKMNEAEPEQPKKETSGGQLGKS